MNAGGTLEANVVLDDHGPISERNVLETFKGMDTGIDIPDGGEVTGRLLIQRRSDPGYLGEVNLF